MENTRSEKNGTGPLQKMESDIKDLERRVNELSELLGTSREMSNILDPKELYSVVSEIISGRFGIRELSIFVYRNNTKTFKQVFREGTGLLKREFLFTDHGAIWDEFLKGDPITLHDADGRLLYPEFLRRYHLNQLKTEWVVPLVMRSGVIGFLALGERQKGKPLSENDIYFLKQIAAQAAVCINTSHLYLDRKKEKEELDRTLYNLSLLYSIGRAMTYISDLKSLLEYILNQAIQITGAEKGSIMLYDIEKNILSIRVLAGLKDGAFQKQVNNNEIKCRNFKPGEGIAGRVFQTGRPMVLDKVQEEEMFIEPDSSFVRSIACIPMMVYSDIIGVINVTNKLDESKFTDEDVELLKAVADQAAVAINKAQLWEMAVTDSLTGLYVRRYIMVKLQEEFHRADRYNKGLSVVMADLDCFKRINDTYGHTIGDRVLKVVSKFFLKNIRDIDIISRYGGEEFLILLPEATKDEAYTVSERLRKKLVEFKVDDLPQLTVSLGIASYPQDGQDVEVLIKKADAALYTAKQDGRNKVVIYDDDMELPETDNAEPVASNKSAKA
jgi:diguanylate cyclase (GGDEF)-like protein